MRAGWLLAALGLLVWVALACTVPAIALAGERAAFLMVQAPVGAVVLLLIARLTGADWDTPLRPLLWSLPLLGLLAIPMVVQQALFIPLPAHLALWLAWPAFALRGIIALGFWWWLSRRLLTRGLSRTGAGLALIGHAIIVDVVALDWIMGVAPGQPETAAGMVLAVLQILTACAAVGLRTLGSERVRTDLEHLLIAACLGMAYLLFVDFLVIWYGNIPQRIGWYLMRRALPWSILPPVALAVGLVLPIGAMALWRARGLASGAALAGSALAACWLVSPVGGAFALVAAAAALLATTPLWASAS